MGILAAVVAGAVGAAMLVASWMLSAGLGHELTVVGSVLLFSVIPLVMGAAHLLDCADGPGDAREAATNRPAVVRLAQWTGQKQSG